MKWVTKLIEKIIEEAGSCTQTYTVASGSNVVIKNNEVSVNGKKLGTKDLKAVTVIVKGDCKSIDADIALQVKVEGKSGAIKTRNGDIETGHVTGNIQTTNGDVTAQDVSQNVETTNGDVECGKVGGSVSTRNGDISHV